MPTAVEMLKSAGWTDEDIAAFDANKMKGIESVFTAAEQERQKAELAQRAAADMFENTITPALNSWGTKEANLEAERDYYKKLAEKAKDGGFVAEVPPFGNPQPRTDNGQFTANANRVPGSPDLKQLESQLGNALGTLTDLQWRYQKLFGNVMPDSPTTLAAEASAQRLPLVEYAARKYDFAGKQAAIEAEEKKKHDDAIRAEVVAERDRYWAERQGSNPNTRFAEASKFTEIRKAVTEGKREDPLKMTKEQRHAATAAAIRQEQAATIQ